MALLAEEVVEEWLNQQGFFTIRGIKIGVQEMDILAIRQNAESVDLRHYEVHASVNPISYISRVPKAVQKATGRGSTSAKKRSIEELRVGVDEWVEKKFRMEKKAVLREKLWPGNWSYHFVINKVRHVEELDIFRGTEVEIIRLSAILEELKASSGYTAAGKDLIDLMILDEAVQAD